MVAVSQLLELRLSRWSKYVFAPVRLSTDSTSSSRLVPTALTLDEPYTFHKLPILQSSSLLALCRLRFRPLDPNHTSAKVSSPPRGDSRSVRRSPCLSLIPRGHTYSPLLYSLYFTVVDLVLSVIIRSLSSTDKFRVRRQRFKATQQRLSCPVDIVAYISRLQQSM